MAESEKTIKTTPDPIRSVQRRVTLCAIAIAMISISLGMALGRPTITPFRAAMGFGSWVIFVWVMTHTIRKAIKPLRS